MYLVLTIAFSVHVLLIYNKKIDVERFNFIVLLLVLKKIFNSEYNISSAVPPSPHQEKHTDLAPLEALARGYASVAEMITKEAEAEKRAKKEEEIRRKHEEQCPWEYRKHRSLDNLRLFQ